MLECGAHVANDLLGHNAAGPSATRGHGLPRGRRTPTARRPPRPSSSGDESTSSNTSSAFPSPPPIPKRATYERTDIDSDDENVISSDQTSAAGSSDSDRSHQPSKTWRRLRHKARVKLERSKTQPRMASGAGGSNDYPPTAAGNQDLCARLGELPRGADTLAPLPYNPKEPAPHDPDQNPDGYRSPAGDPHGPSYLQMPPLRNQHTRSGPLATCGRTWPGECTTRMAPRRSPGSCHTPSTASPRIGPMRSSLATGMTLSTG